MNIGKVKLFYVVDIITAYHADVTREDIVAFLNKEHPNHDQKWVDEATPSQVAMWVRLGMNLLEIPNETN